MIYIGVDGGGSKTALAAYEDGALLATARVGAINYNFIGVEAAAAHLIEGVQALGLPLEDIAAIGIGDPSIDDAAPTSPDSPTARFAALHPQSPWPPFRPSGRRAPRRWYHRCCARRRPCPDA